MTDETLANLTDLHLSNVSVFYFDDDSPEKRSAGFQPKCKSLPGDLLYPGKLIWKVLDILSGGALIKTVPLGAACYEGENYDEAKCDYLIENWGISETQ